MAVCPAAPRCISSRSIMCSHCCMARLVAGVPAGSGEAGDARPWQSMSSAVPHVAPSLWGEAGEGRQQSCPRSLQAAMLELLCFTSGDAGRLGSDSGRAESQRTLADRQHRCTGDDTGTGMQTISLGSMAKGAEQLCLLCLFSLGDALFTLKNTCYSSTCTGKDLSGAGSPAVAWQSRASCSLQL